MSIKNIVVTAKTAQKIDLDLVEQNYLGLCYRNSAFRCLNLKDDVTTLCQLFQNGRIIVIGGKTQKNARQIFDNYIQRIIDLGHPIAYFDYKIQNIIACYTHTVKLNLTDLAQKNHLEFEPELFPAVRFRTDNVTVNIFHTGKCMILGAKSTGQLKNVVQGLENLLNDANHKD